VKLAFLSVLLGAWLAAAVAGRVTAAEAAPDDAAADGYLRGYVSAVLEREYSLANAVSHLGDEFLLDTPVRRINLSYEAVDGLLGFDLWAFGRVYAGGGYMVHVDPADLKPGYTQTGVELISPWAFLGETLRPLAVLDVQWHQEESWTPDYSTRFGFRVENPQLLGSHRLYLLGEYFDGHPPNGQFFVRRSNRGEWESTWSSDGPSRGADLAENCRGPGNSARSRVLIRRGTAVSTNGAPKLSVRPSSSVYSAFARRKADDDDPARIPR